MKHILVYGHEFERGRVQDLRIYNRRLSSKEVKTLAQAVPIREAITLAADKRTKEQNEAIFDYWITTRDKAYTGLVAKNEALKSERDAIKERNPVTHIQQEKKDSMPMANILFRGQYDKPKDKVTGGVPAVLHAMPKGAPTNRLGLAKWINSPENPLTARVTVNRFWREVFGVGLVKTAEDFGSTGEAPVNQELITFSMNDLNRKQYASYGKAYSISGHFFNLKENYTPGNTADDSKLENSGSHKFFRINATAEHYFSRGWYRPGIYAEAVFSNQKFFIIISERSLMPRAFSLFQTAERWCSKISGHSTTLRLVCATFLLLKYKLDFRLEGYAYKPLQFIAENSTQDAIEQVEFTKFFFAGTGSVIGLIAKHNILLSNNQYPY